MSGNVATNRSSGSFSLGDLPWLVIWGLKECCQKAYGFSWPRSFWSYPLAVLFVIGSAVLVWQHYAESSTAWCLFASIIAGLVTSLAIWPPIYVVAEKVAELTNRLIGGLGEKLAPRWLEAVKSLPGARQAWDQVQDEKRKDHFFLELLSGLSFLLSGFLACHAGYLLGTTVQASLAPLSSHWLVGWLALPGSWVAGALVGTVSGAVIGTSLWSFMDKGRTAADAIVTGLVLAYAAVTFLSGSLGLLVSMVLAVPLFVAWTAYGFPQLDLLVSVRLKRVREWAAQLRKQAYRYADPNDFTLSVAHVFSAVLAVGLAIFAGSLAYQIGLWSPLAWVLGGIVALFGYIGMADTYKRRRGNDLIGLTAALAGALAIAVFLGSYGSLLAWLASVGGSVLAGFAIYGLVYPLLFTLAESQAQSVCERLKIGRAIDSVHNKGIELERYLSRVFDDLRREALYEQSKEQSSFKRCTGHLLNIGCAVLATVWLYYALASGTTGFTFLLRFLFVVVVGALAYVTGGRMVEKNSTNSLAYTLATLAGLWVAAAGFQALTWFVWLKAIFVLCLGSYVAWAAVTYLYAPLYVGLKKLDGKVPNTGGWKERVTAAVVGAHQTCWQLFDDVFWSRIKEQVARVAAYMKPHLEWAAKRWAEVMKKIDAIFGRGRSDSTESGNDSSQTAPPASSGTGSDSGQTAPPASSETGSDSGEGGESARA